MIGLVVIVQNLKEKVFMPLDWHITSEMTIEPSRAVKLAVHTGRKTLAVGVLYKPTLLDAAVKDMPETDITILSTKYIGKPMLERLKARGVSAMDEAGNYFFFLSARQRASLAV